MELCNFILLKGPRKGLQCLRKVLANGKCSLHQTNLNCDEWLKNVNLNPLTGRTIIEKGLIYRKYAKQCLNNNFVSAPKNDDVCKQWLKNKLVNPVSGRKISPSGKIYKSLNRKCLNNKYFSVRNLKNTDYILYQKKKYKVPKVIGDWSLGKRIGSGGYGVVYESHFKSEPVAVKLEPIESFGFQNEISFYLHYKNNPEALNYIPYVLETGVFEKNLGYIVMEKLYQSKSNYTYRDFRRVVECLEYIAKQGLSHSDVKFTNMMRSSRLNDNLVLVDFGMVSKLSSEIDNIYGTPAFMSTNLIRGRIEKINDLESFFYNILSIIRPDSLPWERETAYGMLVMKEKLGEQILNNDTAVLRQYYLDNPRNTRVLLFGKYVFTKINNRSGDKIDYEFLKKIFD